jgi:predicted ABC-type ATPase
MRPGIVPLSATERRGRKSPLKPELAAIAAARMALREIDRPAADRADFAFETTLSGRTYVRRMSPGSALASASKSCIFG